MPSPDIPSQNDPRAEAPLAAVALIRTTGADPEFLLLRRAVNLEDPWSGHFALPGGRREQGDRDLLETCIRETREECGLVLKAEQLVLSLPWAHAGTATNHPTLVAPFLFEIPGKPFLSLASLEISEFHWLPLSYLRDPGNHARQPMSLRHPEVHFPCVRVGTGAIWGFTYGVLLTCGVLREIGVVREDGERDPFPPPPDGT